MLEIPKKGTALALDVYEYLLEAVESFEEDHIGSDLAYLMPAIIKGAYCEWGSNRPIISYLKVRYNEKHPLWVHIKIEKVVATKKILKIPVDFYIEYGEGQSPIEAAEDLAHCDLYGLMANKGIIADLDILGIKVRETHWEVVESTDE